MRKRKKETPEISARRQPLRSLTPRDNSSVFSYHAARQMRGDDARRPEVSGRVEPRIGSRFDRVRFGALILGLFLLFVYFTWLGGSSHVVVEKSTNSAVLLQNTDRYQQAADSLLRTSLANHNKLTLDSSGIAAKLAQQFPELADVSVQTPLFGHQVQIYITSATASLILDTLSNQAFLVASSGKVLAPADTVSKLSSLHLPTVIDQSGLPLQVGSAALPSTNVNFIQIIVAQLQAAHITLKSLTLPRGTSELDVRISGKPYYIKFNLEADADQQVGTFLSLYKYLNRQQITPAQYIDVRALGRAYYK